MDLRELKKLQEQLKKDQEILKKGQEILKKGQEKLLRDQAELIEVQKALASEKKRLGPLSVIEPVKEIEVNPKWLKDQIFRGKKEGKPIQKPGKKFKTKVFTPFERPMEVADVLSFRVDGNEVVLVTADGQKLRVEK